MAARTTKHLFEIFGILIILFGVGFSGCTNSELTPIKNIRDHPEYYINRTVLVKGRYAVNSIMDESGYMIEIQIPDGVITPTPFRPGLNYTFTGIVSFGKVSADGPDVLFLAVKQIETPDSSSK